MRQNTGISAFYPNTLKSGQSHQQLSFDCAPLTAAFSWALKVCACLLACLLALPIFAQNAASVVRWNGSLPEASGRTVELRFALYQDQAGGLALWQEKQEVAVGADGRYSVLLGAATAEGLPAILFQAGEARWIEARPVYGVNAEAQQPSAPARSPLAMVPYAFKSIDAETLAGRAAGDYVTREDLQSAMAGGMPATLPHPDTSPSGSGTTGYVPLWTGISTLGNSVMAETGTSVGIDTATPATALDVNGATTLRGNTSMPALGTATAAGGFSSPLLEMSGSSFQAGGAAVNQKFAWEVQPQDNNTASPSSVLSLLYAAGTGGVTNTGFSILPSGSIFSQSNVTVQSPAATPATGHFSAKVDFEANVWNSTTAKSVPMNFAFSALPTGNNTANPSANLSLEFATGSGAAPTATGLSFAPNGVVTFAPSQTFPSSGINIAAIESSLNADYAQLAAYNDFTQGATFNGPVVAYSSSDEGALSGFGTSGTPGVIGSSDTGSGVIAKTGTGSGVTAYSATPANGQAGVFGYIANSFSGTYSTEKTGQVAGVWGDTVGNPNSDGNSAGVIGTADNANGGGFYNNSQGNPTVWAQNYSAGGNGGGPYALYATVGGTGGTGVTGIASGDASEGVSGVAQSNGSDGVYGEADGTIDSKGYPSIAVQGFAKQATGVMGTSFGASVLSGEVAFSGYVAGVWGDTASAGGGLAYAGVMGTADNNVAGYFENNSAGDVTVRAVNADGTSGGLFKTLMASTRTGTCGIGGNGDLTCTGQVKALVSTGGGTRKVETYSAQSPENWMEDYGTGVMERGVALVKIDPGFAETISETSDYHVFITPGGDAEALYVIHKTATGFEVRESKGGTSSLTFDYKVVAKRRGYEAQRLTDVTEPFNAAMKAADRHMKAGVNATAGPVSIRRPHADFRPPEQAPARPGMPGPGYRPATHP